jgi:hypothetical protein
MGPEAYIYIKISDNFDHVPAIHTQYNGEVL